MKRTALPAIGLAILAALFVWHAVWLAAVTDDAFISFRFARNLACGQGLVWNPGDRPVEGYTNFLWVLLCAAAIKAGGDVIRFTQALGVAAGVTTLAYVYGFSRRLLGQGPLRSMLPCVLLVAAGPFAAWATSGMETSLFTLLVTASCYHAVSHANRPHPGSLAASCIAAFLATLTRPEGLGVLVVLAVLHVLYRRAHPSAGWRLRDLAGMALGYVLPFLAYGVWRLVYYGDVLPNTFYAKTGGTIFQWWRGLKYVLWFVFHYLIPLAPLLVLGAWEIAGRGRRPGESGPDDGRSAGRYGLVVCLAVCAAYAAYIVWVGGDYMAMYRFFVPVLPVLYLAVSEAAGALAASAAESTKKRAIVGCALAVALAGTLLPSTWLDLVLFREPDMMHGQFRGICIERWNTRRMTLLGQFFRQYSRSDTESLAAGAIGAISYYSNLRAYDFYGIVDPVVARLRKPDLGKGLPGHEKADLPHLLSMKPAYFIFSRNLTARPEGYPVYSPQTTDMLRRDYRPVSRWLEDRENGESGYFTFLELKTHGSPALRSDR